MRTFKDMQQEDTEDLLECIAFWCLIAVTYTVLF